MDSSNAVKSGISISTSEPLLNGSRQRSSFFFGSIPDRNEVLKIVRGFWSQIRTPARVLNQFLINDTTVCIRSDTLLIAQIDGSKKSVELLQSPLAEDYKLGEGEDEESRDFRRERELETASRNAANDVKNKLWELHFHDYGRGVAIFRTSKLQELVIKGKAIKL